MDSAFLGTFQTTFVADRIHHDLALVGEEIGGQDKQDSNDAKKCGLQPEGAVVQLQAVKDQRRDKQRGHQQDHAGITKAEKGLEELHRDVFHRKSDHSYDARGVGEQGQIMVDMNIRPTPAQYAADLVAFCAEGSTKRHRPVCIPFNPIIKIQNRRLSSAPVT